MPNMILEGMTVEELSSLIKEVMLHVMDEAQRTKHFNIKHEEPSYLTRKEVAEILGVSLVTLHKWSIQGEIPSYRIGTRIRFRREDIDSALSKVKSLKYSRIDGG